MVRIKDIYAIFFIFLVMMILGVAMILAHQSEPDVLHILPALAVVDRKAHTKFLSRIVLLLVEHDLRVALGPLNA